MTRLDSYVTPAKLDNIPFFFFLSYPDFSFFGKVTHFLAIRASTLVSVNPLGKRDLQNLHAYANPLALFRAR